LWRKQRKIASFEFASKVLRDFSTEVFRACSLKLAVILTHAATVQNTTDMQVSFFLLSNPTPKPASIAKNNVWISFFVLEAPISP
jgi:hypothetical protein